MIYLYGEKRIGASLRQCPPNHKTRKDKCTEISANKSIYQSIAMGQCKPPHSERSWDYPRLFIRSPKVITNQNQSLGDAKDGIERRATREA